ncbi:Oxidase FUB9 [Pseudocercospora fuligena]|uniref:Oxidase FUB9 n=1 Tax=Pseudocercospora fuligena TaxID=685502 RepID=A0A8H6RG97_9PEZI|nr:Oxidase FUB9 [Pseudocercospora fuligena]
MANRGITWDPQVHTISDLKALGSARLPKMYRDYYNEGAMDLITLRDNEDAYNRYKIKPRILVNVDNIDLSSSIFGCKTSMPIGISPSAMHKLAHPDGELGTSRAAASFDIAMCLSSYATESIESVAAQGKGNPYAMQMCVLRDRKITTQILRRAESAGCKAFFLSVDVPMLGRRLNEYRNNFILPDDMKWPNLLLTGKEELPEVTGETQKYDYDPSLDWENAIAWLRSQTKMQLWLKGVTNAEDVLLAVKYGIDGIIVSNHGGRQLDGQPATLDSLRECVAAAAGKIPVAIDGGIRRGSDVFKALALGACHVFIGRIPIWGLAYNGQQGIELGLKILMQELKLTMGLAGCRSIRDISRNHVTYLNSDGILAKL